eukprot:12921074-Prorocentrum_lima.AAC.1
MEWSDKYHDKGDMLDGVYAEIHKVEYQDMIAALKEDGLGVTQGDHEEGPREVYQAGFLGHLVGLLRAQLSVPHLDVEGEMQEKGEGPWAEPST